MKKLISKIAKAITAAVIMAALSFTAVPSGAGTEALAAGAPTAHELKTLLSLYTVNATMYGNGKNSGEGVFFTTVDNADAAAAAGYTISAEKLYSGTMSLDNFYKTVSKHFNKVSKASIEKALSSNNNASYNSSTKTITFSGGGGGSSLNCEYESHTRNGSVYTIVGRWRDSENPLKEYDDVMLSAVYKDGTLKILSYGTPIEITKKNTKISNAGYTGKATNPTSAVRKGVTLTSYDFAVLKIYNNKRIGTATAEITGVGRYTGKFYKTFKIVPKKVTVKSVKAGKKKITVKYGKVPGGVKYQIAYKTGKGKWKYKASSSGSVVLKGLKKGKKYTIKVRGYKYVGGKKYSGSWSKAAAATVK